MRVNSIYKYVLLVGVSKFQSDYNEADTNK